MLQGSERVRSLLRLLAEGVRIDAGARCELVD